MIKNLEFLYILLFYQSDFSVRDLYISMLYASNQMYICAVLHPSLGYCNNKEMR